MLDHLGRRGRGLALVAVVAVAGVLAACSAGGDGGGRAGDGSTGDGAGITRAAVDASFGELDEIVEAAMAETGVPGVAVAVVHDDEVRYEAGYGVRNVETGEPVGPETVFQIASLSKPVSSTVMAGLVGQDVIAWDQPIAEVAPELQLSDPWVSAHVTFEDLFAHRSGLPGASAGNDLEVVGFDRAAILPRLALVPLEPFRATYSYSNFGMTMAGEAAAVAAGRSWEEVSDQVLFEPAGMAATSMRHADFVGRADRADLHVQVDGSWVPLLERTPDAQAPAGGASSNVVDLGRWIRLQLAGGSLDGVALIDGDALDRTHTPMIASRPPTPTVADPAAFYGLGWNVSTDATGAVRWDHSGAFSTGAATTAKLLPAAGLGIVVLTNGAPIGVPEAIADAYLELLQRGEVTTDWLEVWSERFGGIFGPRPPWAEPVPDPEPARPDAAYVGTYGNDYVGEARVVATAGGLVLQVGPGPTSYPLEHWDADTFTYRDAPESPDHPSAAAFTVVDGVATAVVLSSLDGAGLGELVRLG